ncbi:hypothetical protein EC973_006614 [Apophysomyces ossiformis]|uniref:Uncharacterized protein n=1 Tax=Apophysomyces ossiformis TaxID=679940 RepID=A0A8H7BW17_9FUNG|nr:hypothetical protein EC973_006614 [Apophysomyces ossiformis]
MATTANKDKISTVNNLMNYSIPLHDSSSSRLPTLDEPRRAIASGNLDTRIRQLEAQIEDLTTANVRLVRTNRILKLDCDRLVDQETAELKQEMNELRLQNIRLQRSNRLLQDDLMMKTEELNKLRDDQIRKMKNVGPEYEYLVQIINLLYRQLEGNPTCDKTCCYTNQPLSQGISVLTLPPESEEQKPEPQHICRPVIHSNIAAGTLASALEFENLQLREDLKSLHSDQEALYELLKEKEDDTEMLKCELRMKDDIVSQLERDFERMEMEVIDLQKDWRYPERLKSESSFSDIHAFPIPPPLPKDNTIVRTVSSSGTSSDSSPSSLADAAESDYYSPR